ALRAPFTMSLVSSGRASEPRGRVLGRADSRDYRRDRGRGLAGTQHTPRTNRIMKGALSRRVALVAQQRARELGGVGAGDEDHEHTAVLGRDMAELEVLDVDGRGTQDLRDPRQHARAVGDADANAVQLPGLGLVRVREQLVAAALRIRDRALDERPVATLERTLDGFELVAQRADGARDQVAVLEEDVGPHRGVRA